MIRFRLARVAGVIIFVSAILLPVAIRPFYEARTYLNDGRSFSHLGAFAEGGSAYSNAIAWRTPFNSNSVEASKELLALAQSKADDPGLQRDLFEDLKRGLYASRSWWWEVPGLWQGVSIEEVQRKIDELSPAKGAAIREQFTPKVNFLMQALSQLFFWGWIGTVFLVIWTSFDSSGHIVGFFRLKSVCCVICFFSWLAFLSLA